MYVGTKAYAIHTSKKTNRIVFNIYLNEIKQKAYECNVVAYKFLQSQQMQHAQEQLIIKP